MPLSANGDLYGPSKRRRCLIPQASTFYSFLLLKQKAILINARRPNPLERGCVFKVAKKKGHELFI